MRPYVVATLEPSHDHTAFFKVALAPDEASITVSGVVHFNDDVNASTEAVLVVSGDHDSLDVEWFANAHDYTELPSNYVRGMCRAMQERTAGMDRNSPIVTMCTMIIFGSHDADATFTPQGEFALHLPKRRYGSTGFSRNYKAEIMDVSLVDASRVLVALERTVRVATSDTRVDDALIEHFKYPCSALTVSPNRQWLAVGAQTGEIVVFRLNLDVPGATERVSVSTNHELLRHRSRIDSLVWYADSRRLVSCSRDGTVVVWRDATAPRAW